jgi:hypothetical protein
MPMTWDLHAENTVPRALPAHKSLVLVNESATTGRICSFDLIRSSSGFYTEDGTRAPDQTRTARYP